MRGQELPCRYRVIGRWGLLCTTSPWGSINTARYLSQVASDLSVLNLFASVWDSSKHYVTQRVVQYFVPKKHGGGWFVNSKRILCTKLIFSSLLCAYAIYYNSCTLNKYTLVAEKFMICLIMHIRSESEKYIILQPWMYDTIKHCHSRCRRFIDFELTDLSLRSIPQRSDAFFISVRILQQVLWQGNNFSSNKFVSDDDSGSWKTEVWLSVRSGRPKMNHGNGLLVKVTTYIDWQAYRILHE